MKHISELVDCARECAELSTQLRKTNKKFKELMDVRYGSNNKIPNRIIELIEASVIGKKLTLKFLDCEMARVGFPPLCAK